MTGTVFDIQRFSTQDGPGIRTTVFLKGCPLHCAWCHNPESYSIKKQVFFYMDKCIGCGACMAVCNQKAHSLKNNRHLYNREQCILCGNCVQACPSGALSGCGERKTSEEVIDVVLRDKPFYRHEGGMTISGGEPMLQADFSYELASLAKKNGVGVCMETSAYCDEESICRMTEVLDFFLIDFKVADEENHKKWTGVSNQKIIRNIRILDRMGAKIILRCPLIEGVNLEQNHFEAIASLTNQLKNIVRIDLEPYHPLGLSKRKSLAMDAPYDESAFLDKQKIVPFRQWLESHVGIPVTLE